MAGKGRRKTENKLAENKGVRLVCTSKRRTGLFKKARELSIPTGAKVGVLAFSPASKPMAFDAHTLETLILAHEPIFSKLPRPERDDDWASLFYKALDGKPGTLWWEKADVQSMGLEELNQFQGAILSYNDKLAMDASFLNNTNVFPSDPSDDSMDSYIMNLPWDRLPELLVDEFQ